MERGVVVGGLMICGSFLLAVSLNRSALEETPPAEPVAADAPLAPPLPVVSAETPSASCSAGENGTNPPVAADQPEQGDLPGNGRKACSR